MNISCLGDSATAGYGVGAEENWVSLLNQQSDHHFVNDGLTGDTLMGMLSRVDSEILPRKPDMVIVLGGWNDLLICKSMDTAKSALMAIVHHCVRAGVMPVVGIPYAVAEIPGQWRCICGESAEFESYIGWLRMLCRTFHLRCVDIAAVFDGREDLLSDGLHPNARGHRAIADAVLAGGWFEAHRRML